MTQVRDNVRRESQTVERKLSGLIAAANEGVDEHVLSPTRPSIERHSPTPDGFHHESAPR